jgi:hypothetical protein
MLVLQLDGTALDRPRTNAAGFTAGVWNDSALAAFACEGKNDIKKSLCVYGRPEFNFDGMNPASIRRDAAGNCINAAETNET